MKSNNEKEYILRILDTISNAPSGLTITEISQKTNIHRNTVSKYLVKLETQNSVFKKEIGAAHLYFSRKREYLSRSLVNSFLKALLSALKEEFPNKEQEFKKIGHLICERFEFPITAPYLKEFANVRNITDSRTQLKLFQKFYNSYDFFQDDLEIIIQDLTKNRAIFRLLNVEFLDKKEDYVYFFYIACGITEWIYLKNLNQKVSCNIFDIHLTDDVYYIDIILEII